MTHLASRRFWGCYDGLPSSVRVLADRCFELLKADPSHPSLHFKKVGKFWSARIGLAHRALAIEVPDGLMWVWIGSHDDYGRLLRSRG